MSLSTILIWSADGTTNWQRWGTYRWPTYLEAEQDADGCKAATSTHPTPDAVCWELVGEEFFAEFGEPYS
jgi:hypothetical protein